MAEFFLANIANEVVLECKNIGIECSSNFINYYVSLLVLDPMWNMYPGMEEINRMDVLRIVNFVVQKMKHQHCPCILSLKTNMYFYCNFESKDAIVMKYRSNLKNRMAPLRIEIIESKPKDEEATEYLQKQIIYYITLLNGMGNPTNAYVYREANQAFGSIYEAEDLNTFVKNYSQDVKEDDIIELADLVTGIRLFNRQLKRGGQGIEDVPGLLLQGIEAANYDIHQILVNLMDTINLLTSAIDHSFKIKQKPIDNLYYVVCELSPGIDYEDMEYVKDLLIVYRQYEVFLRKLLQALADVEYSANSLYNEFLVVQENIQETVYLKIAVHTELVYPLFLNLSDIWRSMQDEIIYVTKINQIVSNLQLYLKELTYSEEVLNDMLGGTPVLTDAERLEETTGEFIEQEDNFTTIFLPDKTEDFNELPIEFLGFCPWKMVEMQGGLIPGNPHLGLSHYNGKFYAFSCLKAAEAFGKSPQNFINEVLQLGRKKPELIPLLQLEPELNELRLVPDMVVETKLDNRVTHEVEIQTELHPVASKIDFEYTFNIWDWKRRALKLANMNSMATKAVQTQKSNFKNEVRLQTTEPREKSCQTNRDNYTNTPTQSMFVYGLRGRKDDKQFVIDLTRPVDEK